MTVANSSTAICDAERAALPQQRHFVIATAGHVDHGKSSLVKELTGTDPDRLPEEKARQITIDLGFAKLNLPGGIHAGIVDVPGHEDFVRNMIAGVGSIDLALFVVAADDGWMPQSEEHLQILTHLGVRNGVIAVTKSDLGKIDIAQVRAHFSGTPFAAAPIVMTSTRTGEGIEQLKSALAAELAMIESQRDFRKPRLFVDRVFTLHGIGTVVTGTLSGGRLHRGQPVVVQPANMETHIRSLQSHGCNLEFAEPGMRTAVNLADVDLDRIKRGDVITISELGQSSVALFARIVGRIKNGTSVYLHHGTSRTAARIFSRKENFAIIRLASPVFAFLGDRFVLRDPSERHTIGGGIVFDPDARNWEAHSIMSDDVDSCLRAEIASREFSGKETLLRKSHFSEEEIAAASDNLQHQGEILFRGEFAATADFWRRLCHRAIAIIDKAHQQHPERPGLDLTELRTALHHYPPQLLNELIADLCANGFERRGSIIARRAHRPALPAELYTVQNRIREALSQSRFDPPARKEIAQDRPGEQVLRFLIENGEVIEIAGDIILLRENFETMKSGVIDFLSKNSPATVSELRKVLKSSRRIMVPFLERLDRDNVTHRVGDRRILANRKVS